MLIIINIKTINNKQYSSIIYYFYCEMKYNTEIESSPINGKP